MVIPAAMLIEAAHDMLATVPAAAIADQRKELHVANVGPDTEDFRRGYELGLQTARVILAESPKAEAAGVEGIL